MKADRRKLADLRRKREAERHEAQRRAAAKASALYERLPAASPDHRYLAEKKVLPGPCRITANGALVVPVTDAMSDKIISLQFIRPDGEKRFLAGGRVARGCCILGDDPPHVLPLVIAEGFATAQSLRQATGWPAVVAFNAGNLLTVAKAMRRKHPDRPIILAADNDIAGITKATEAAKAIDARLVVPSDPGDFNDMVAARGAGAVKDAFVDKTPEFIARAAKGIAAAEKATAAKAKAERQPAKEERQRATDKTGIPQMAPPSRRQR